MDETKTWTPERGTPQGAVVSPLLANIYLHPVDVVLVDAGCEIIRCADDLVIMCRSEGEAHRALNLLESAMAGRRLTLHPQKTRVVDATAIGGFDFLGYHFECGERTPCRKSLVKLRDNVRVCTPRNHGGSLAQIVAGLNPALRGWFEYFKHSHRRTFGPVDSWVRSIRSVTRVWSDGAVSGMIPIQEAPGYGSNAVVVPEVR